MNSYLTAAIVTTLVIINIGFAYIIITLLKKIKSAKPDGLTLIQFPTETEKKINELVEGVDNFAHGINQSINKDQKQIFKDISEQLKTFETFSKEKSNELKQYKEGYDLNKNKALFF